MRGHAVGRTSSTTIKVSRETRDRLKRGARAEGSTLEEYLIVLISERERRGRLDQMEAAWRATPEGAMQEYLAESTEWELAESRE